VPDHGLTSLLVLAIVIPLRFLLGRGLKARPRRRAASSSPHGDDDARGRFEPLRLVLHQARYDLRAVLRDRRARAFTVAMPVILLVVLCGILGDRGADGSGGSAAAYVPGIAALAVIASSFTNLVVSVVAQREAGVLRRRRATPVPAWVLVAGRVLAALAVSTTVVAVVLAVGRVAFGVGVSPAAVPALLVALVAGAVSFACLGYALATAIRSADAAQPAVQALLLPLLIGSGVLVPASELPANVHAVASIFPVERLADAFHRAYGHGAAPAYADLAVLLLWGAAGLAVALRRFRFAPSAAAA